MKLIRSYYFVSAGRLTIIIFGTYRSNNQNKSVFERFTNIFLKFKTVKTYENVSRTMKPKNPEICDKIRTADLKTKCEVLRAFRTQHVGHIKTTCAYQPTYAIIERNSSSSRSNNNIPSC